jgi:arginine-tRNA-protein transferase
MALGMRRSGTLVYRPVCPGCRKCQPFRLDVARFTESRSQRRVRKRCDGLFTVDVIRPSLDPEHLKLYARYQQDQHDKDGQQADEESYARFLVDSVADSWELRWRDGSGKLVGVGIVDVVDDGISTVYFYWDPDLRDLSLGVYSALWEIDLCRRWKKQYYYLGYLVRGSKTMSYKSQFSGGEVWDGTRWLAVPGRELDDPAVEDVLARAEAGSMIADRASFPIEGEEIPSILDPPKTW